MSATIQKKTYTVVITKDIEDGGFVGRCDELHANTQGETYGKIMENMKKAVELAAKDECHEFNLLVIEQ